MCQLLYLTTGLRFRLIMQNLFFYLIFIMTFVYGKGTQKLSILRIINSFSSKENTATVNPVKSKERSVIFSCFRIHCRVQG